MNNVVVLGGSGFVGRYIASQLSARAIRVTVPARRRERAKHLILLPTVDVVDADVHDEATLLRLFRGAEAVVNLVGILHGDFQQAHVELARKVVAACRESGVARLLHMSALNAAVDGPSKYLRSKGEAESIVAESGLAWTIFRPSVIFGREDRFLNMFAQLNELFPVIPLGCPNARFQPVFVEDVAKAFVQSLDRDATAGERYSLCGPKVYTLAELVRYAGDLTGHRRPVLPLPEGAARLQATVLEMLPGALMTRDNVDSMRIDSVCDGPFPAIFGFSPAALETMAPTYLGPTASVDRYAEYRAHLRR
jgi:NADH dehydrogenase